MIFLSKILGKKYNNSKQIFGDIRTEQNKAGQRHESSKIIIQLGESCECKAA